MCDDLIAHTRGSFQSRDKNPARSSRFQNKSRVMQPWPCLIPPVFQVLPARELYQWAGCTIASHICHLFAVRGFKHIGRRD